MGTGYACTRGLRRPKRAHHLDCTGGRLSGYVCQSSVVTGFKRVVSLHVCKAAANLLKSALREVPDQGMFLCSRVVNCVRGRDGGLRQLPK